MVKSALQLEISLLSEQAAYIAGIVDGEGSIGFNQVKSPHGRKGLTYVGRITVTNTHLETLKWMRDLVGFGSIQGRCVSKNWKMCYQLSWLARQARTILPVILPYLRIKRRQAELVNAYLQRQYISGLKLGLSSEEWTERLKIVNEVQTLNRRGPVLNGV